MNYKKLIIGGLIVVLLAGSVYLISRNGVSAETKKARRIVIQRQSLGGGLYPEVPVNSTDVFVRIPATTAYYKDSDVPLNKKAIDTITTSYGVYIDKIAKLTNVSSDILKAFIFVESGGNETIHYGGTFGLMQIDPASAGEIMAKEYKKGRLSNPERAIIRAYLGENYDFGSKALVPPEKLVKPELNILIGAIYLGLLIDEETHTKNGVKECRLDYVIARYNRGYYRFNKNTKPTGTVNEICEKLGACNYIKKIMGVNGILEGMV